jgi:hypothetical protein
MYLRLLAYLLILLGFSGPALAQDRLAPFTVAFEQKLARLSSFFTSAKSFVGKPGIEQVFLVDVAANGQVVRVIAREPVADRALAMEGHKLITSTAPFSALTGPIAEEFPLVRVEVTLALSTQPGLLVKRVQTTGSYKYVPF